MSFHINVHCVDNSVRELGVIFQSIRIYQGRIVSHNLYLSCLCYRGNTHRKEGGCLMLQRWNTVSPTSGCIVNCTLSQVNGGIQKELEKEVLHYNYHASFFDIFVRSFRQEQLYSLFTIVILPFLSGLLSLISSFYLPVTVFHSSLFPFCPPLSAPGCLQVCHSHPGLRRL